MEQKQIKVADVLNMLAEGKTREEIREHYGLSKVELKKLFQHPKLKGRKTHKKVSFEIIDDEEEDVENFPEALEANNENDELEQVNEVSRNEDNVLPNWENN